MAFERISELVLLATEFAAVQTLHLTPIVLVLKTNALKNIAAKMPRFP